MRISESPSGSSFLSGLVFCFGVSCLLPWRPQKTRSRAKPTRCWAEAAFASAELVLAACALGLIANLPACLQFSPVDSRTRRLIPDPAKLHRRRWTSLRTGRCRPSCSACPRIQPCSLLTFILYFFVAATRKEKSPNRRDKGFHLLQRTIPVGTLSLNRSPFSLSFLSVPFLVRPHLSSLSLFALLCIPRYFAFEWGPFRQLVEVISSSPSPPAQPPPWRPER